MRGPEVGTLTEIDIRTDRHTEHTERIEQTGETEETSRPAHSKAHERAGRQEQ